MSHRSSFPQRFAHPSASNQAPSRMHRRMLPGIALNRAVTAAADYTVERLEKRRLLSTVLTGPLIPDINGVPQEAAFEYLDGQQEAVRIALFGNITASFTFVHVTATSGAISFSNLVSPTAGNIGLGLGSDLFNIDVTAASPDASISIARVPLPSVTGPRPMEPFGNPGFTFTTQAAVILGGATNGLINITPDANTGAILLGAREFVVPPAGGTETQTGPLEQFDGVTAGLTVNPGVSMNRFFFGGTVIGRVDIGGSIDTFYAGQILTGDAGGLIQGQSPADTTGENGVDDGTQLTRNFNVSGDIENLISRGAIGTVATGSTIPGDETYLTGFRLSVGGHVGEIQVGGDNQTSNFIGSAIIEDSASFKGLGTTQHEEEGEVGNTTGDETAFEANIGTADSVVAEELPGIDAGVPSLGGAGANGGKATFNNDTAEDAQLLGTLFSSADGHGNIQLLARSTGRLKLPDLDDYYGVALDAGQTINVTVSTPDPIDFGSLSAGIFSPEALSPGATNDGGCWSRHSIVETHLAKRIKR